MTYRNLRETHFSRECGDAFLVFWKAVGVDEYDCDRFNTVGLGSLQIGTHRRQVGLLFHGAVGTHPLVNFGDALVEHVGLDDVAGENFRARLIADLERVTETLGDQ